MEEYTNERHEEYNGLFSDEIIAEIAELERDIMACIEFENSMSKEDELDELIDTNLQLCLEHLIKVPDPDNTNDEMLDAMEDRLFEEVDHITISLVVTEDGDGNIAVNFADDLQYEEFEKHWAVESQFREGPSVLMQKIQNDQNYKAAMEFIK